MAFALRDELDFAHVRTVNRAGIAITQGLCAVDMVVVVVGEQDGLELELVLFKIVNDWGGLTGVNDGGVFAMGDKPDGVVFKGGNGVDVHGVGHLLNDDSSMLKPAESLGDAMSRFKYAVPPLWLMALLLLAGVASVLVFPWLALQLVVLFSIVLVLAAGAWFFRAQRAVFVGLAWLVLSMAWGGLAVHEVRSGWLPAALEVQKLTFDVRVVGLSEPGSRGTAFAAQVVLKPQGVEHFPETLRLHWYDEPPLLRPGEVWRVTARLKRPHGAVNGVGMDYEAWLFRQGVQATGSVSSAERVAVPVAWSMDALRWQVREHLMTLMAGEPSASLVLGLVLGDRSLMTQAQWDVLLASGTNHLLAISGLHVTMIAGMVWWLVAWAWRRLPRLALWIPAQVAGALAGLLAALAYSLLAGFSVPTQRTLFMLLALVLAVVVRRELVARDILGLALLLVLL